MLFTRGLKISRNCPTVFGSILGAGISIAIFMQALINMGMSIGLLPTKGLTLPLVSYGGSSLVIVCFSLGILVNLSRSTPLKMRGFFYDNKLNILDICALSEPKRVSSPDSVTILSLLQFLFGPEKRHA